jgi:hypothetical protein
VSVPFLGVPVAEPPVGGVPPAGEPWPLAAPARVKHRAADAINFRFFMINPPPARPKGPIVQESAVIFEQLARYWSSQGFMLLFRRRRAII